MSLSTQFFFSLSVKLSVHTYSALDTVCFSRKKMHILVATYSILFRRGILVELGVRTEKNIQAQNIFSGAMSTLWDKIWQKPKAAFHHWRTFNTDKGSSARGQDPCRGAPCRGVPWCVSLGSSQSTTSAKSSSSSHRLVPSFPRSDWACHPWMPSAASCNCHHLDWEAGDRIVRIQFPRWCWPPNILYGNQGSWFLRSRRRKRVNKVWSVVLTFFFSFPGKHLSYKTSWKFSKQWAISLSGVTSSRFTVKQFRLETLLFFVEVGW